MSIYDYSKQGHAGGYTALRVTRMIGGEISQRYFSLEEREEAEAYDAKLAKKQAAFNEKRRLAQRSDRPQRKQRSDFAVPPRVTGVTGIRLSFNAQRNCNPRKHYAAFTISATHHQSGARIHTSRSLTPQTDLTEQWRSACKLLAEARGLKRAPSRWLSAIPSKDDFEKLRKHYVKKGVEIPKSTIAHL